LKLTALVICGRIEFVNVPTSAPQLKRGPFGGTVKTKKRQVFLLGAVCTVTASVSSVPTTSSSGIVRQDPPGWVMRSSVGTLATYSVGIDSVIAHGGTRSAYIQFQGIEPQGWATLMQTFRADAYRGKRVRLSAFVKTQDVEAGALLWMRIEGPGDSVLAFDNMGDRPIRGAPDWRLHDVVLEVPTRASAIAIGLLLEGGGRVWIDDVTMSAVAPDVALTAPLSNPRPRGRAAPVTATGERPRNLDFEH